MGRAEDRDGEAGLGERGGVRRTGVDDAADFPETMVEPAMGRCIGGWLQVGFDFFASEIDEHHVGGREGGAGHATR